MNRIEQIIAAGLLDNEIVALRFAAAQEGEVSAKVETLRRIARKLGIELKLDTPAEQAKAIREFGAEASAVFDAIATQQAQDLAEFMALTSEATVAVVNGGLAVDLFKRPNRLSARVESLLIDGAPSRDWWKRQADAVQRAFAREVRTGFVSGETTEAIARRIVGMRGQPGILDVTLRQARTLAHSSVMTVANASVQEVIAANDDLVKGYYWVSTLDSRTCPVCGARDGLKYGLDHRPVGHKLPWGSGPGAVHMNCRCATTAWLKTYRELGLDIDEFEPTTRASADGPVSAGLTFEKWIEAKPQAVQREWFGPGRYELYRDGKITLRDLTNMRGRELTLSQLRERYG
jgi:SPP1 gp7 family putative phage head morphogenesis protein